MSVYNQNYITISWVILYSQLLSNYIYSILISILFIIDVSISV